jgi:UDP-N-acetylmuramate: L-alanyl-gamma-D-glutamyl-meso-diaminopimelate ligase
MHLHILGICGTFMGGIARLAVERGHRVTGADQQIYPPMSHQLAELGCALVDGYGPEGLDPAPDLVVIGNALSRGNPAVEAVLDRGLPYCSGPEWLAREVLQGRTVVAVAGTHGKTTTTSLVAYLLEAAGQAPGFLVGGVPEDFGQSARLGAGAPFVVEADEYDTAFFDKRSKFVHYRPRIAILNNLEYDHADIFPDLAAIERQFHHLVRIVPGAGRIIHPEGDEALARVLAMGCWTPRTTIGEHGEWRAVPRVADFSRFGVERGGAVVGEVSWGLLGAHNAANALAALAAVAALGVAPYPAAASLAGFRGVARRLQRLAEVQGVTIYDDFAHHPTAIAATLAALRARVGTGRIRAVLEPRSNTMRLGVHKDTLAAAVAAADEVVFLAPTNLGWDLEAHTRGLDGRRRIFANVGEIVAYLAQTALPGDHVLIMSNGGFEGIQRRLEAALASRPAPVETPDRPSPRRSGG